jgi:tetratricopeptide (TPR) repeat protein
VARNGRAEVLKAQNRLAEALAAYDSVIAEFPGDVVARTGRAEMLKAQNRYEEALLAYESVNADFPFNLVARNGRASVLALTRRWEDALAILPEGSPVVEEDWTGYHIRAMVLLRMGKPEAAIKILEDGVVRCPRPAQREYFRTALAIALLKGRAYGKAWEMLEQVESPPLEIRLNVLKFHASGALGDVVRATEASQRLRAAEPLPPLVQEIGAELHRRYIEKRPPLFSDDLLVEKEIDLLLAA